MQVMKPEPQAGGPAREGQAGKKPVLTMICLWCEARWLPILRGQTEVGEARTMVEETS